MSFKPATAFDILHYGVKDLQGDVFMPGSIKFDHVVKLVKDFDPSKILGYVEIVDESDRLLAVGDIEDFSGLYPGIGFTVIKSRLDECGFRIIEDAKLVCVSIGNNPNTDKTIKPLP